MKRKWILATTILILTGICAVGGLFLYYKKNYVTVSFSPVRQQEVTDALDRPDCGWYQLYAYALKPGELLASDRFYLNEMDSQGLPYRVALVEINLGAYAGQDLDDAAKQNIHNIFTLFAESNTKMILRFLYDWDGKGTEREPKDINMICAHMRQAGELIKEFADHIYTTQGIFVGDWAEMHGSNYLSTQNMTTLTLQYASATEGSVYLAVRTPNQYRSIMEELTERPEKYAAFGITAEELKKRLGLFNDGMLGSVSDLGSYAEANVADAAQAKEARDKELAFQQALCASVPNGGEAVSDNPFNNWENAIKDLRTMHISYLNQMYDSKVLDKWKQSVYQGEDALYQGMSAYDYITAHLGARFVLRNVSLSYAPFQKGEAFGTLTIENTGFSNLYHRKDFTLSL